MEIVQEITLEKGVLFKILIISSEVKSQVYIIGGQRNAGSTRTIAWKVEESQCYDFQWSKNGLIHLLLKLVAYKMKEGFTLVGNFVYEDHLTLHGMNDVTNNSKHALKEGSEVGVVFADHSPRYGIDFARKKGVLRKSLKGGTSIQKLAQYFHLPINEAARHLNICPTVLKKICRKNGLPRWAHRKLQSITRELEKLRELVLQSDQREEQILAIADRIYHLEHEKRSICFQQDDDTYLGL